MKNVLKAYSISFAKYFLFAFIFILLISVFTFYGAGSDVSLRYQLGRQWSAIFLLVNWFVIFGYLSYINFKVSKEEGLKAFTGLIVWFPLIIAIDLYNMQKNYNSSDILGMIIIHIFIILLSSLFIFWGNHKKKKKESQAAEAHNFSNLTT